MSTDSNTDYVAFAYAAVVAAGGMMGYVKKGSVMSGNAFPRVVQKTHSISRLLENSNFLGL